MIKTETIMIDNKEFIRTYSDENKYVVRDGVQYEEAVDLPEWGYTYEEGDPFPIEETSDEEYAQIGQLLMGGEVNEND